MFFACIGKTDAYALSPRLMALDAALRRFGCVVCRFNQRTADGALAALGCTTKASTSAALAPSSGEVCVK